MSPACRDRLGKTALHRALERSQTDPELMLEAFADHLTPSIIAIADRTGRTALHVACMKGYEKSATKLIELSMKKSDLQNGEGNWSDSEESERSLASSPTLSEGSIVCARDYCGWTALHFASFYNRLNIVRLLISANAVAVAENGTSQVHVGAVSPGNKQRSPIESRAASQLGRESSGVSSASSGPHAARSASSAASSGTRPSQGIASAGSAVTEGRTRDKRGSRIIPFKNFPSVDVNAASNDGWTALHAAASQGHEEVLSELLVRGGGDPNRVALHGQSPLHVACLNSHANCVRLLREHDADPKMTDKSGLTSFACASKEIRLILRKTHSKIETSARYTSVVGMPHQPSADREAKFAIQARDKWNRRRTQGGDYFEVQVSREIHSPSSLSSPSLSKNTPPMHNSHSDATTSDPAPIGTASSSRSSHIPDSSSHISGSSVSTNSSTPISSSSRHLETVDEAREKEVEETSVSSTTASQSTSRPVTLVHNVETPRVLLRQSQTSSTPTVLASFAQSKSKTNWADSRIAGDSLNTIADEEEEDFPIPRAQSDMTSLLKQNTESEKAGMLRVATYAPAKITTAIKDLESGLYILRWRPPHDGNYHVSITLRGVEIQGSPFLVSIAPCRSRVPADLRRVVGSTNPAPSTPSGQTNVPSAVHKLDPISSSAIAAVQDALAANLAASQHNVQSEPSSVYGSIPVLRQVPSAGSEEETLVVRSPSAPVDLISGIRPDITPKSPTNLSHSNTSQKDPKKDKKDKKSRSEKNSNPTPALLVDRGVTTITSGIGSQSPLSISPSSTASAISGTSSAANSDLSARKRSSSMASKVSSDSTHPSSKDVRGRSGSELRNTNQISSDPGRNLPANPIATLPPPTPDPEPSLPPPRPLYRMTSTFSPMRSASNEATRNPEDQSKEIADLQSQVTDLNKQLSNYATRIQELETEQIVAEGRREAASAEEKKKVANLSALLQAEIDARLCRSCRSNPKNAVAVPCLHFSHCNSCIETLQTCPICSTLLKGFITAQLTDGPPKG